MLINLERSLKKVKNGCQNRVITKYTGQSHF